MRGFSRIASLAIVLLSSSIVHAHETGELIRRLVDDQEENIRRLVDAAEEMERSITGVPSQWFEMESLVGWEKMMLIFGYADNKDVCLRLVGIASAESPNRRFRCSAAN